ncbi:MAG TPA: PaaX family transcriptional regulator C-terminal domain-containing protein, partial [Nevskiaceae bacterium]|nr:PaaX family transcriptional regulator C-terminal domain-containing protein [Nevskiaceae bacterium]
EAAGRGAYRLGAAAMQLAGEVAKWREGEARVRPWNGDWLAVHTAPLGRRDRAAARTRDRALDLLGLRELDPGLYLRPDNLAGGAARARERLLALGLEAQACVFVASAFDAAREQRARKLWDGAALTRRYLQGRARLDSWLARADELDHEVAARESYRLGDAAIRELVFDPLLPDPLVDTRARAAYTQAMLKFDRAGHAIWRTLAQPPATGRDARIGVRRTH